MYKENNGLECHCKNKVPNGYNKWDMRLALAMNMCIDFNNRFEYNSEGRYKLLIELLNPGYNEPREVLMHRLEIVAAIARSWHESLPSSTSGRYVSICKCLVG